MCDWRCYTVLKLLACKGENQLVRIPKEVREGEKGDSFYKKEFELNQRNQTEKLQPVIWINHHALYIWYAQIFQMDLTSYIVYIIYGMRDTFFRWSKY